MSIRINARGENTVFKPLDSFSIIAVKLFQSQYKEPIKKNTRTLFQQSAFLNDTGITDNDDRFEKKNHKMMILFPLVYQSLMTHLRLKDKKDLQNKNKKPQTAVET